jgi:putative ABC transport system permease protein
MIQYEGLGFGLVSTILGCIIGVIIIYITSSFLEINTLTFDFEVSWVILLLCTLFGLAISLFASFSPAKRAAKTELSEALRYE